MRSTSLVDIMMLKDVIYPTTALSNLGLIILSVEILILAILLTIKPWVRYKFLHNKGISFFISVFSLFFMANLFNFEVPDCLNVALTIINIVISFIILPIFIVGILFTILFFIYSFLMKTEIKSQTSS